MGSMQSKYEFILKQISDILPVYVVQAPTTAKHPYAVIDFTVQNEMDYLKDELFLDIDVWHKSTTKKDVFFDAESITDDIESRLKYLRATDDEHGYMVNQLNRIRVPDEDTLVQHRKLKYYVKAFNRY